MEAYANQYPNTELLSLRFKKAVHEADVQLSRVDPYVMMCNSVEEYLLSRKELDRVDLARRCFYFKVGESMSRPDQPYENSWRRAAMRELVTEWGWGQARLETLDQRMQWKIKRVLEERSMLVGELTRSYRALSQFAREQSDQVSIRSSDLNLLGRRLYVAFERKAGKVDIINPGISLDLSEERLSLHYIEEQGQPAWALYRGSVMQRDTIEHAPLKRTASLLELLAWCHFNGLVNRSPSSVSIHPPGCELSHWELRGVLDCLQQLFPGGGRPRTDIQSLAGQATVRQAGLFINLARDPMAKLTRNGMQLVSERIDPLSYGGQWENLAISFETVIATSWGEVLTYRYAGRRALLDCLCDYFSWLPVTSGKVPPHVACFSFSSSRGPIIARRLEALFGDVSDFFYRNYWRRHARYVLRVAQRYYVLQCEHDIPRYQEFESQQTLLQHLSLPQEAFSPIRFDKQTLDESPLGAILERNTEGQVQFFYQLQGGRALVYILDERGSLYHQSVAFHDRQTLLGQFMRFLDSVRYRIRNMSLRHSLADRDELQYFQINRDAAGQYMLEPVQPPTYASARRYLDVQVIGDLQYAQHYSLSIFCGDREFSALEYGDSIFEKVAEHIARQRRSGSNYPIYITDIDLNPATLGTDSRGAVQSIHFLDHKKRVESKLNEALQKIRRR
jgi:adenylate cyclase class 1